MVGTPEPTLKTSAQTEPHHRKFYRTNRSAGLKSATSPAEHAGVNQLQQHLASDRHSPGAASRLDGEALGGAFPMNAMTLLRPARKILTATAVAVVALTCLGTGTGSTSIAGHQGAGTSTQATKEWKTTPSVKNLVVATKEYQLASPSRTKEW
jgi:hypothetical protein